MALAGIFPECFPVKKCGLKRRGALRLICGLLRVLGLLIATLHAIAHPSAHKGLIPRLPDSGESPSEIYLSHPLPVRFPALATLVALRIQGVHGSGFPAWKAGTVLKALFLLRAYSLLRDDWDASISHAAESAVTITTAIIDTRLSVC
jgi:hypothetical protein